MNDVIQEAIAKEVIKTLDIKKLAEELEPEIMSTLKERILEFFQEDFDLSYALSEHMDMDNIGKDLAKHLTKVIKNNFSMFKV